MAASNPPGNPEPAAPMVIPVPAPTGWLEGRSLTLRWETAAWLILLVAAIVTRFYNLGARAMSHDESLHALYSYYLYDARGYQHNPMMHGPFLFHTNALVYLLLGDNDFTARVMPALFGVGVVMFAYAFRRYLGRSGALALGVMLTISPILLYYGRYIRNDIYITLDTMLWIYGIFRYLESPKRKWIYVMLAGMAPSFITKEVCFMQGVIIGGFVAGLAAWRHVTGQEKFWNSPAGDLAMLMLTLVLPFASPLGHFAMRWPIMKAGETSALELSNTGLWHGAIMIGLSAVITLVIGLLWFGRLRTADGRWRMGLGEWGRAMAIFWVIQILFFTTFFTNFKQGMVSGIVGSVGYWMAQHGVKRGDQPIFYYAMIGALYEFLPLILTVLGVVRLGRFLGDRNWEPVPEASRDPALASEGLRQIRVYFVVFLLWWTAGAWVAYSIAGEKMPWLLTHIATPMCFMGAWWAGGLLDRIDWSSLRRPAAIGLALATAVAAVFLVLVPPTGASAEKSAIIMRSLRLVLPIGIIAWLLVVCVGRIGPIQTRRLVGLGLIAALAVLTARAAFLASYRNYDLANELLVYAHGTPDIKKSLRQIDDVRSFVDAGSGKLIAYDSESSWPMTWYFRNMTYHFYAKNPTDEIRKVPAVMAGPEVRDNVRKMLGNAYVEYKYLRIWWPPEGYKHLKWKDVWATLTSREKLRDLWQIVVYRNYPGLKFEQWPQRGEMSLFIRRGPAEPVVAGGGPELPWRKARAGGLAVFAEVYGGRKLSKPRALAVAANGQIVIADTGNDRMVVLDGEGKFVRAFGTTCKLDKNEGCVDPDGPGPLQPGDGQFNEPWGVAVAPDGTIYVSDTWNGRIQAFDAEGRFLRKWGRFGITSTPMSEPNVMYGPRGIVVLPNGDLLVADTGHKRLLQFRPDGQSVRQFGGEGSDPGKFREPVGLAIDPRTQGILVADTWNQRIQLLSQTLQPYTQWPVSDWTSQKIYNKPFVAVDDQGLVYATDPDGSRVMVFGPWGGRVAAVGGFGKGVGQFDEPNGIAYDPLRKRLLVADANNNRIAAFAPLSATPLTDVRPARVETEPGVRRLPMTRRMMTTQRK